MVQTSRKSILPRSTQSVATETTEGKTKIPSVMQNSVSSVLLLLLLAEVATFAACQAAADSDSPTVNNLLVIPQKNRYALGESLDPENDLFIFLVWSDGRHEAVTCYVPNNDPEAEDPLMPNPDLQVIHAAFDIVGTQVVYVLYKTYYANYFVLVYDPNAVDPGTGGGDTTTPGTGIDVVIPW
jgi:hypothetical protein